MIHPLLLAYVKAYRVAHLADGAPAPTGVTGPAMARHRAEAAWQSAGCPLYVDAPAVTDDDARDLMAVVNGDAAERRAAGERLTRGGR